MATYAAKSEKKSAPSRSEKNRRMETPMYIGGTVREDYFNNLATAIPESYGFLEPTDLYGDSRKFKAFNSALKLHDIEMQEGQRAIFIKPKSGWLNTNGAFISMCADFVDDAPMTIKFVVFLNRLNAHTHGIVCNSIAEAAKALKIVLQLAPLPDRRLKQNRQPVASMKPTESKSEKPTESKPWKLEALTPSGEDIIEDTEEYFATRKAARERANYLLTHENIKCVITKEADDNSN